MVLYVDNSGELWSRRFAVADGWYAAEVVGVLGSLAMDSRGFATVLSRGEWRRSGRIGGWSDPLSTQATGALTADPLGNVFSLGGQDGLLWSSRFTPTDNSWSEPKQIGTGGVDARLAANAQGNAIAVWSTTSGIWWNRFTPVGGWATAKLIDGTSGATMPEVALAADGTASLVWAEGNRIGFSEYR
jgi:hypothetical protein